MGSSTDLLCYSTFVLFKNKDTWHINAADSEKIFFNIRSDIEKLALASYMCELEKELAPEEQLADEFLRLILNSINFMDTGKHDHFFIKPIFELRIISLAGYMPNLVGCCNCGKYEDKSMYFSLQQGQLYCMSCESSIPQNSRLLPFSVVYAMRHIIYSDFNKIFSFTLGEDSLKILSQITEEYIHHTVEKTFNSLEFYKNMIK